MSYCSSNILGITDEFTHKVPKSEEALILTKLYARKESTFSEVGANAKIDVRTSLGKGMLKERLPNGMPDYFSEELVYRIAVQIGVPCVFTKWLVVDGVDYTFSRYETSDVRSLITLSSFIKEDKLGEVSSFSEILDRIVPATLKQQFILIMALDFITRQHDRNTLNASLFPDGESFYPLYDNGISLFAITQESTLIQNLNRDFDMRYGKSQEVLSLIRKEASKDTIDMLRSWEPCVKKALGEMDIPNEISELRLGVIDKWVTQSTTRLKEALV